MENLVNPSIPFDVSLLDSVRELTSNGTIEEKINAQRILIEIENDPMSYVKVSTILHLSKSYSTQHFALQILYVTVKNRYNKMNKMEVEQLRQMVMNIITILTNNPELPKYLLTKANQTLVEIIWKSLPNDYLTFINDIIQFSKPNGYTCMNSISLLKLLNEEILNRKSTDIEYSSHKIDMLKQILLSQLSDIYTFIITLLNTSKNELIIESTLNTLQVYISLIKPKQIEFSSIIITLINLFKQITIENKNSIKIRQVMK